MFGLPGDRPGRRLTPQAVAPSMCKAYAYLAAAASTSAGGGLKVVPIDTIVYDTHNIFDRSNNCFRPIFPGYYYFHGHFRLNSTQGVIAYCMKNYNGSLGPWYTEGSGRESGVVNGENASALVYCNGIDDHLKLGLYDNSGGQSFTNDATNCFMTLVGPL